MVQMGWLLAGLAAAAPVGEIRTRGLRPTDAAGVVAEKAESLAACTPADARPPSVRVLVEADGHVSHVGALRSGPPAEQACVERVLRSLRFPPPRGGLGMVAVGGERVRGTQRSLGGHTAQPSCRAGRWAFVTAAYDHCAAPVLDALWRLYPDVRGCSAGSFAGALPVRVTLQDGAVTAAAVLWDGLSRAERSCVEEALGTLETSARSGVFEVDYLFWAPSR